MPCRRKIVTQNMTGSERMICKRVVIAGVIALPPTSWWHRAQLALTVHGSFVSISPFHWLSIDTA